MHSKSVFIKAIFINLLLSLACIGSASGPNIPLKDGWKLFSSEDTPLSGKELSSGNEYQTLGIETVVPSTIMNSLREAGVYKNLYFSKNLAKVDPTQFEKPWWYVKSFDIQNTDLESVLKLEGINYEAEIWLNGVLIASKEEVSGVFNQFSFDVSENLKKEDNTIAIKVYPPSKGAYTIGFVDWAPVPPDKNMGLWRPVSIEQFNTVQISNPYVISTFKNENYTKAELTVLADLKNASKKKQKVTLEGTIGDIQFSKTFSLAGNESRTVSINSIDSKALEISSPKLWWPYQYGTPHLYDLELTLKGKKNNLYDQASTSFGIREIKDYFTSSGWRGYKINGKKILIKGAGWVDDLFLGNSRENIQTQIDYVKDMHMNCVRLEGFWGTNHDIYEICDKEGILLMAGFSCQWEWEEYIGKKCSEEFGCAIDQHDRDLLASYMRDMIVWLRNHPSIFVWVGGSDYLPHPELEKEYIKAIESLDKTRPYLAAASNRKSAVSGPTGVKMEGPYDYVTPNYWYTDTVRGGAYGFNTETGPGPQPPVLESIKRMMPEENWWPIDSMWDYHCGRHAFHNMDKFLKALHARYGTPRSLNEFDQLSQMASYEAIRPMFEAFRVNKYHEATGIIQWMLNSSWAEFYWQLYDSYLMPTSAYFGTKKACAPIQGIYNYGDGGVYLANDLLSSFPKQQVSLRVYNSNSELLMNKLFTDINIPSDSSFKLYDIPKLNDENKLLFIDIRILDTEGNEKASNFYWVSTVSDIIDPDYSHSSWVYTPTLSFGDLNYLKDLNKANVALKTTLRKENGFNIYHLEIENKSKTIVPFTEIRLLNKNTQKSIVPTMWSDNFISLLPGETRKVIAKVKSSIIKGPIEFQLNGINIQ